MKSFNVINFNFNAQKFVAYDIIPYLVRAYQERVVLHEKYPDEDTLKVPTTFDEFKQFVIDRAQYQFWARCEYEIILVDWPCQKTEEKWDVYDQIMMNIDIITQLVIDSVNEQT